MSTTYSGNITFTNGTNIVLNTPVYTGTSTITTGTTITIGGTATGNGTITGNGLYTYPYTYTSGATTIPQYVPPYQPFFDGYGIFTPLPKKEADVLVDELKSSVFADLDKNIEALENNKEVQNYDEVVARAELMHEMLAMAAEMIKERLDKLKKQSNKLLFDEVEVEIEAAE